MSREIREETGLDVSNCPDGYRFTYRRDNPDEGDNYFVDVYRFELDFEIRQEDWEQTRHTVNGKTEYARKVEHDGRVYEIKRTYKTGKAKMEVICG